ncbi:protein sorting system archaetidylserine decarboxylase [Haloparvum sp. AD34]
MTDHLSESADDGEPPLAKLLPFAVVDNGWRLARIPALLGVPFLFLAPPVGVALFALSLATLLFHRDPDREAPDSGAVAPADGTVSVIREEGDRLRVGVFMNVDDVHVNRAPMAGEVREVRHRPGAYKPAFSKDSDRNEQVVVDCGEYELFLIAGWFARRIHPAVAEGDEVERGERIGHISFGSRADVLFPASVERDDLEVSEGETVRAGESVLVESIE